MIQQVEAKRAVPRSEVPREIPTSKPSVTSASSQSNSKSSTAASSFDGKSSHGIGYGHDANSYSDSRLNDEDLAFNKIFVGGLHYDTRDGKYAKMD